MEVKIHEPVATGVNAMTREERSEYWHALIEQHTESGLSASGFCKERHINLRQFYWWRRRFQSNPTKGQSDRFIELVPFSKETHSGIRVRISDGLCIEVERGFDPCTLRTVIEAICDVGNKPCLR